MATEMYDDGNRSADTIYYKELKEERQKVDNSLRKVINLVDKEIERLENSAPEQDEILKFTDATKDKPIKLKERIMIPIKEFPKFNFVGKILGPKGNTLKRLQEQTGCRMAVLGKGSVRSKEEEDKLLATGDPKYSHLRSDLHVFIEAFAPPFEAYNRMAHAIATIKPFLIPDFNDDIRASQFEEIAMMGGSPGGVRPPPPWKANPAAKKMRTGMGGPMGGKVGGYGGPPMGPGGYGGPEDYGGYDSYGGGMPAYSNGSGSYGAPPSERYGGRGSGMTTDYNHLSGDYGYGGGDMMGGPPGGGYGSSGFDKSAGRGGRGGLKTPRGGRGGGRPSW